LILCRVVEYVFIFLLSPLLESPMEVRFQEGLVVEGEVGRRVSLLSTCLRRD